MRTLPNRMTRRLADFARDERGVISAETVIMIPLLVWVFLAMFVWWDAFRTEATTVKATYTIADMLSRENEPINNAYITGMHRVYRYMVATPEPTWIRVTSISYSEANDRYNVLWSRTTNSSRAPAHTTASINMMRGRVPDSADADTLIVVETWRNFSPAYSVGVRGGAFHQISVTRPRWLSPLPIS